VRSSKERRLRGAAAACIRYEEQLLPVSARRGGYEEE
jgi:hypothetical protein